MYAVDLTKLRDLRRKKKITLQQASEAVGGKSYNKIWHIENGTAGVKAEDLRQLADLYEVDINELFFRYTEKKKDSAG